MQHSAPHHTIILPLNEQQYRSDRQRPVDLFCTLHELVIDHILLLHDPNLIFTKVMNIVTVHGPSMGKLPVLVNC